MAIGFKMTLTCDGCDERHFLFSDRMLTAEEVRDFVHKYQDQGWFIADKKAECLECFGVDGWEPGIRRGAPAKRPQLVR